MSKKRRISLTPSDAGGPKRDKRLEQPVRLKYHDRAARLRFCPKCSKQYRSADTLCPTCGSWGLLR